ncbi:MAG: hypothetical protein JWO38_1879 [Gemmataceae bacterium]|nr:hypothetical protein [Gemmataceae bacterium]
MANIASVSVAAFLRGDAPVRAVTRHGLLRALTRYFGESYCVPAWGYDDYPRGCVEVQCGEKWSPTGVDTAWARYGKFLDAVWVRWYDSGGDHDAIFRFEPAAGIISRLCRYGFERVRMTCPDGVDFSTLTTSWRPIRPCVWEADVSGTYLAGNDRCDLLRDELTLPSPTTPVRRSVLGTTLDWASAGMPASLTRMEEAVQGCASAVEFLWRGRATRVYRRYASRWGLWCLDNWDNCHDPDWLAYCANRPAV